MPGTAVFLTRTVRDAPPVMVWHVRHNRALHERVFILNVATQMLRINVLGLASIASDVTSELARATIASVTVLGAFQASPAVKAALADRTR